MCHEFTFSTALGIPGLNKRILWVENGQVRAGDFGCTALRPASGLRGSGVGGVGFSENSSTRGPDPIRSKVPSMQLAVCSQILLILMQKSCLCISYGGSAA